MSIRKTAGLLALALTFVFSAVLAGPIVNAQNAGQQGGGSGLQVSPTRTDLSGQPGEKKTVTITLKNITQTELTAQAVLNDFKSDNSSGTPQIIVDNNQRTPYTLEKMIKNLKDVDLKAGETKEIKLDLEVPGNAVPGAYFGAVRFAALPKGVTPTEQQRQVALTASVAHLIFLEVPGDVNEQLLIESLKAQAGGRSGSFFFKKPDQVAAQVKNNGNGFSRPFGQVTVNGPFGKEVHKYEVNDTDPRGIVLPQSSRAFTDQLKGVSLPGKYKLTASIAYGNGGEVVTYKSSFIYLPLWAIIAFFAVLLLIAGGAYTVYRKRFAKGAKGERKLRRKR